jgi:hypothetical protein
MRISSFNNFINERLGVSESSLIFASILENKIQWAFRDFVKSDSKTYKKTMNVGYRLLRPYIKNLELYSEFPVVKFEIDLDFNKLTEVQFKNKYPDFPQDQKLATGGHASYFGNKNWSGYSKIVNPIKQVTDNGVIINLGVSIDIRPSFDLSNVEDFKKMEDDISSTLYHELHHCYENYVRVIKNTNILRPESRSFNTTLSWAENIWKYPKPLFKFWSIFTYYLYVAEYHETRANIQEIYYFIKKYPNKDLKDFNIYQTANKMENFNYEQYYQDLLNKISEKYPGSEEYVANRFKSMWVKTYKKECEVSRVPPIISFETLEKMDCKEFLKYWQKRINNAGKTIKRKAHNIKANI